MALVKQFRYNSQFFYSSNSAVNYYNTKQGGFLYEIKWYIYLSGF